MRPSSRRLSSPSQTPAVTADHVEVLRRRCRTQATIGIKKLGRFNAVSHRFTGNRAAQSNQRQNGTAPGWEYLHVAIDDNSRVAFSQIKSSEKRNQQSRINFEVYVEDYYAY